MTEVNNQLTPSGDAGVIKYLEQEITSGKHWYIALLEAIGFWDTTEETYNERCYRYLIADEAFDWILLAERLCQAVDGLLPDDEKAGLLFHGEPPINVPTKKFKELIGGVKFNQYLNYFYGITVEEALLWAVQEEVRKERRVAGYSEEQDTTNAAYQRIYGATKAALLRHFREDRGYPQRKSISLTELKEFTYWLFKYRLMRCDKAKVASDTKKALNWLNRNGLARQLDKHDFKLEFIDILPSTPPGQA